MSTPEYYTPATLAKRWGCHTETVCDLLRAGKLKGFKLGHQWRITDAARLEYETGGGTAETTDAAKPRLRGTGKLVTRLT